MIYKILNTYRSCFGRYALVYRYITWFSFLAVPTDYEYGNQLRSAYFPKVAGEASVPSPFYEEVVERPPGEGELYGLPFVREFEVFFPKGVVVVLRLLLLKELLAFLPKLGLNSV